MLFVDIVALYCNTYVCVALTITDMNLSFLLFLATRPEESERNYKPTFSDPPVLYMYLDLTLRRLMSYIYIWSTHS